MCVSVCMCVCVCPVSGRKKEEKSTRSAGNRSQKGLFLISTTVSNGQTQVWNWCALPSLFLFISAHRSVYSATANICGILVLTFNYHLHRDGSEETTLQSFRNFVHVCVSCVSCMPLENSVVAACFHFISMGSQALIKKTLRNQPKTIAMVSHPYLSN